MTVFIVLSFIILCIVVVTVWVNFSPRIDIITSRNKYIVLLWYNKWYWNEECKRTYIKLFEV